MQFDTLGPAVGEINPRNARQGDMTHIHRVAAVCTCGGGRLVPALHLRLTWPLVMASSLEAWSIAQANWSVSLNGPAQYP
jgi:hypothetical protein